MSKKNVGYIKISFVEIPDNSKGEPRLGLVIDHHTSKQEHCAHPKGSDLYNLQPHHCTHVSVDMWLMAIAGMSEMAIQNFEGGIPPSKEIMDILESTRRLMEIDNEGLEH